LKNKHLKYALTLGLMLFILACSVKKDKFINRNFHAVTTEYNVLYNGNMALDAGLENLKATFNDNFWEVLPVERMQEKEENFLPGQTKNPNFTRAEEKAVKAIQKHSMNIGGTERNPQMDEAYLLLAKSRYFENRFIPSLESLNYILYKYPQSDKIYHAKVWREKVNIRLENNEVAIKNLKKLLEKKDVMGQDLADANAMLSQAYRNVGSNDTAIATIKIARKETKNNEEKARYSFILGQLYESFEYNDSAFVAFQEVIDMKRRSPRRYVIQAHAKQAQQFDYKNGDTLAFVEKFTKLIEDRENRPFLDILYHQMGVFYDKNEKPKIAEEFYNKSIKSFSQDEYLVSSNYRNIGEIYFKDAQYKIAGKYYDSTLLRLKDGTREYRKYKKKRLNLVDVIKYETIAQVNDSILNLVAMNDSQREEFFQKYIEKLKIADELKAKLEAEKAEKEANIAANSSTKPSNNVPGGKFNPNSAPLMTPPVGGPGLLPPSSVGNNESNFYFYNPVTVSYGKREFEAKWGKRELKSNWRMSSDKTMEFSANDVVDVSTQNDSLIDVVEEKYTTKFYILKLPTSQMEIDSLSKDRNFAYYQLGVIYKEKFKEYELAVSRLEQLLKNDPEERLILPAKYNLFKIYEILKSSKADVYKNQIIAEYPDSRYAQIVQNPSIELTDNESPDKVYYNLYKLYQDNAVRDASEEVELRIDQFFGDESLPKFELLKANIKGRLEGIESYKKALNFVALTYPDELEGKQAESLLQNDIPKLEAFELGKLEATSWKIIFVKDFPLKEDSKKLTEKINKYIKDRNSVLLKASTDLYTIDKDIIVIHGFKNQENAKSVLSVLQEFKDYKIKDKAYIISSEDYKIIQFKKNLNDWLVLNKQ
jgi:tetratricopeptide (TPR) repeat protein